MVGRGRLFVAFVLLVERAGLIPSPSVKVQGAQGGVGLIPIDLL